MLLRRLRLMNSLPEAASDAEKEKEKLKITGVAFVFAGHWPNGAQLVVYQEKGHRLLATMSLDCCVDHVQAQRAQIMDKHYDAERASILVSYFQLVVTSHKC